MVKIRLMQRSNGKESLKISVGELVESRRPQRKDYSGVNSLVRCPDWTVYSSNVTFQDFDVRYTNDE